MICILCNNDINFWAPGEPLKSEITIYLFIGKNWIELDLVKFQMHDHVLNITVDIAKMCNQFWIKFPQLLWHVYEKYLALEPYRKVWC